MSLLKAIKAQLGLSNTPANNFLFDASADNGTIKLQRGNGQDILTVDANGVVASVQGIRGGLFSGTAQNTTSGTSIDFTGIPSWVKRITVMFNGVSTSGAGGNVVQVQLGTTSGVETTGYSGRSSYVNTGVGGDVNMGAGFNLYGSGGAANTNNGAITLSMMGSNIWVCSGCVSGSNTSVTCFLSGTKTLSGTLDRLRITTMSGTDTFDAGSVNILYEG